MSADDRNNQLDTAAEVQLDVSAIYERARERVEAREERREPGFCQPCREGDHFAHGPKGCSLSICACGPLVKPLPLKVEFMGHDELTLTREQEAELEAALTSIREAQGHAAVNAHKVVIWR